MAHYYIGVIGSEDDLFYFTDVLNALQKKKGPVVAGSDDEKDSIVVAGVGRLQDTFDKSYSRGDYGYQFISFSPTIPEMNTKLKNIQTEISFFILAKHRHLNQSLTKSSDGQERLSEKNFLKQQIEQLIELDAKLKTINSTLNSKTEIQLKDLKTQLEGDCQQLKAQLNNTKIIQSQLKFNAFLLGLEKPFIEYSTVDSKPEEFWTFIESMVINIEREKKIQAEKEAKKKAEEETQFPLRKSSSLLDMSLGFLSTTASNARNLLPGAPVSFEGMVEGAAGLANNIVAKLPGSPLFLWSKPSSQDPAGSDQGTLNENLGILKQIRVQQEEQSKQSLLSKEGTRK